MARERSRMTEQILPPDAPVYWDTPTYAKISHRSVVSCVRDRMLGRGPKWLKIGRRVLYPRDTTISYFESQTRGANRSETAQSFLPKNV
jgi:hypothetical protein